jgi:hypothetical protein
MYRKILVECDRHSKQYPDSKPHRARAALSSAALANAITQSATQSMRSIDYNLKAIATFT